MADSKRLEWAADVIEIQQLAYSYAIAADSKDPERMAENFVDPAVLGNRTMGRAELTERFASSFKSSPICILNVGNHLVEFDPDDPDRATGTVYCRCEAEWNGSWLIQQIVYLDEYARQNGKWLFSKRHHLLFYGAPLGTSPLDMPPADKAELTDGRGSMPGRWPSYRRFWEAFPGYKHY